jgi:hypothetical protein
MNHGKYPFARCPAGTRYVIYNPHCPLHPGRYEPPVGDGYSRVDGTVGHAGNHDDRRIIRNVIVSRVKPANLADVHSSREVGALIDREGRLYPYTHCLRRCSRRRRRRGYGRGGCCCSSRCSSRCRCRRRRRRRTTHIYRVPSPHSVYLYRLVVIHHILTGETERGVATIRARYVEV